MKWIIITSSDNKRDFELLNNFFYDYETSLSFYHVDTDISEQKKAEIYEDLKTATNVLLLNAENSLQSPQIMCMVGMIIGKEIPFFTIGFNKNHQIPIEYKNSIVFKDINVAIKELKKNLPIYIQNEKRKYAIDELYKRGITFTPESFAKYIEKNNLDVCNLFLQAGMDINSVDKNEVPMICRAARKSNKKTMEWLLDNGANIDAISGDRGYSAVMDAVWKANDDLVELLCQKGANLDFISRDGQSVLVLAIGGPSSRICDILIEHNANPYIKDKMGMSAFDYATLFKQTYVLELIEKHKQVLEAKK